MCTIHEVVILDGSGLLEEEDCMVAAMQTWLIFWPQKCIFIKIQYFYERMCLEICGRLKLHEASNLFREKIG